MCRRCTIALVVLSFGFSCVSIASADVFNMGGTRNPTTGIWTGSASLTFVPVGNAGNAADPATGNLYGSVGYNYQMGQYDVTVGQYTAFLNAVAKTDTYGLYNGGLATGFSAINIIQNGTAGNYSYAVGGGYSQAANCPLFDVGWGDAARFCNWLQNGQPTGTQGTGTTETGAYTLNGAVTSAALMAISRNVGAMYFIPSENEWYKAAYYDPNKPGGAGYWAYPTKSSTAPSNVLSATGTNNANFYDEYGTGNHGFTDATNYLTAVGAFVASPGAYGTFDMGGDVFQWNEANIESEYRGLRGGDWYGYSYNLAASSRVSDADLTYEYYNSVGFRVASVPEPGSLGLLLAGAISVLAYAWRRRAS